ncbi:hypothetical protein IH992_31430 [Candidatus Poribacteria bacterium]|nr:hypothetical protein [Candidatus Poribacteria bacterium]
MRLFIVENDKGFRHRLVDVLREAGHTVRPCAGLMIESPQSVHRKGYDLALIDRRAKDDSDEDDTSGEDFGVQLCRLGTPVVLMTAFPPSSARIFDLLRRDEITGVVNKIFVSELPSYLERYEFSGHFPNGFAKFAQEGDEEDGHLNWKSIQDKLQEYSELDREEFATLFRSLVSPCATDIILKPISGGQSGAALVRTKASCGDGIDEDLAIKYGEKIAIRSEAMRYDRFVGPLPDGAAAQLRWRAETETLGALAYSWVSDSLEDAIPFGKLRSGDLPQLMWKRRRNAISLLFYVSLNRWYEIYRGPPNLERPKLLLDHYTGRGGVWYDETDLNHLTLPPPDMPEALTVTSANGRWDFGEHGKLVDAVEWAMENLWI